MARAERPDIGVGRALLRDSNVWELAFFKRRFKNPTPTAPMADFSKGRELACTGLS